MSKVVEVVVKGVGVVVAACTLFFIVALALAYPIMWTWNYAFTAVFGLPEITVWQALWGSVCIRLALPTATMSKS